MIRTELFMEGQQVDMSDEVRALFTYAIDDIREFGTRNTSFSKTILLPGTIRNNAIFGNAFEVTGFNPHNPSAANIGTNFNATRAARALILADGIQVFKGVLRVLAINVLDDVPQYECAVFGEMGGLMARLANRYLTDLDFSAYDTEYTTTEIIASWAANVSSPGSGVYWPLIDYGEASTNKVDYQYHTFRPALYVKEYIEKMMAATGYTYTAPFFNTDTFERLFVPHNEDKLRRYSDKMLSVTNNAGQSSYLVYSGPGSPLTNELEFPDTLYPGTMSGVGGSTIVFEYTGTSPVRTTVAVQINGFYDVNTAGSGLAFILEKNGTAIGNYGGLNMVPKSGYTPGTAPSTSFAVTLSLETTLDPGDTLAVRGYKVGTPTTALFRVDLTPSTFYVTADTVLSQVVLYGEDVFIEHGIPKNFRQTDFFLSICKMFNLYVYEDATKDKHVHITPYPDFYGGVGDAVDWTEKVDRGQPITLQPMAELAARFYTFTYQEDGDYYNESYTKRQGQIYGSRIYDAGTDFASGEKEIEVAFAPTPIVSYSGIDKPVSSIFKRDNAGVEESVSSKPRVMLSKVIYGQSNWYIKDGTTNLSGALGEHPYAGHVDDPYEPTADINFGALRESYWAPDTGHTGATLFAVGYSAYMTEITDKDSKMMICFVRLTALDIASLDFTRPVIIDGALWHLNKIADFDPLTEKPTRCELLRVINLSY